MDISRRYPIVVWTMSAAVFGYTVLHPFAMIAEKFFHRHATGELHLHWHDILPALFHSFEYSHLPHALSFVVLSAAVGYFYGARMRMREALRDQLERFSLIGRNAAGIIHDLNNPLAGIQGNAELLKAKSCDPLTIKYCERMIEGTTRISRLMDEIKITARDVRTMHLQKEATCLESFVVGVLSGMQMGCDVSFKSSFHGQVDIDRQSFERVIWNLVKNACEAAAERSDAMVGVALQDIGGAVQLAVKNNGAPIPPDKIKRVFTLGGTFGKKNGTGLGLYNCRRIVKAHSGRLWLSSDEKAGTEARVVIPKRDSRGAHVGARRRLPEFAH